jgi:hypothetical protein
MKTKQPQFLVEFKNGVGWTCETHREALLTACDIILERATADLKAGHEHAERVIRLISAGQLTEAMGAWNELPVQAVKISKVVRKVSAVETESLRARAEAVLNPEPEPDPLSLAAAIAHARHQAKGVQDPKCQKDHAQLADWLEDLRDLYEAVQEWRVYADEGVAYNEALIDTASNLRGCYE